MKNLIVGCLALCSFATCSDFGAQSAGAAPYRQRQYYSSWSYQPQRSYYVRRYYYKPAVSYSSYHYHYCVYYPRRYSSQPRYSRYVYYYNPRRRVYWGRFDLEGKPGEQYSLLKKADQKENLDDIPEEAFPKPGKMPVIPDSEDMVPIEPIKADDLPDDSKSEDLPAAPKKP